MKKHHFENDKTIRAALAAAPASGEPPVRVQVEQGGVVGFAARMRLPEPQSPAFPGFVCLTVLERMKSSSLRSECLVFVERRGVIERLSQWSFSQSSTEVVVCCVGDESSSAAIEIVLDAIDEWREGKHRLFDSDGYTLTDQVAVHVAVPKRRMENWRKVVDLAAMAITIAYAVKHLMGR